MGLLSKAANTANIEGINDVQANAKFALLVKAHSETKINPTC